MTAGERTYYSTPDYADGGTIAGSGSTLLQVTGFNPTAGRLWFMLFDSETPADGDSALQAILVEPGANFSWVPSYPGRPFFVAMQWRVSSTGNVLTASTEEISVVAELIDGGAIPVPPPPVYTTSVGADANGWLFREDANLPEAGYTRCFWAKYGAPQFGAPAWQLERADVSFVTVGMAGAIDSIGLSNNFQYQAMVPPAPPSWTFFGVVVAVDGLTADAYWAAEGDVALQGPVSIANFGNAAVRETVLGPLGLPAFQMMANFRGWDAVLSVPELLAEFHSSMPVRTADIYVWLPLDTVSGTDQSGQGNDFAIQNVPIVVADAPIIS